MALNWKINSRINDTPPFLMLKSFVFSAETAVVAAELSQIKHLFGFRKGGRVCPADFAPVQCHHFPWKTARNINADIITVNLYSISQGEIESSRRTPKSIKLPDPLSHFWALNLSWFCVYRFATWIMDVTTSSGCLLPIWRVLGNPLKRVKPSCVRSGQSQSQVKRDCPLKMYCYCY